MSPKWFEFDPNRAPDSDCEAGEFHHLCVGNEGRALDFRRTPVRITRLCDDSALATVEILAFEDKGALWDLPYEEIGINGAALVRQASFLVSRIADNRSRAHDGSVSARAIERAQSNLASI